MVKNSGGNKTKGLGRKFLNAAPAKTRFSQDPDEIYACCSKMHGPSCDVLCIDGKTRLCSIANKFKGRNKHQCLIAIGTWLLIGRRSYETVKENKKENCDLLEVYSDNDKRTLQQHESDKNWSILASVKAIQTSSEADDLNVVFGETDTFEYEEMVKKNVVKRVDKFIETEEDIDIDDL